MKQTSGLLALAAVVIAMTAGRAPASPPAPSDIETALAEWRLDEAAALLEEAPRGDARTELEAELAFRRADYPRVAKLLAPLVRRTPDAHGARVLLGRAQYALGQAKAAHRTLDALATAYNRDRLQGARALTQLGISLHLNGFFKSANRAFGEAVRADRSSIEARIAWAELFAAKYNYAEARAVLSEASALAARASRTLPLEGRLLEARLVLDADRAAPEARKRVEALIDERPTFLPAQLLLARLDLEDERPEDAIARLQTHVLALAPASEEALALLGACHRLRDDDRAYEATRRRAVPRRGGGVIFFRTVAAHLERVHRYADAIATAEEGLARAPDDAELLTLVATGHSRMGDDRLARTYLERAHAADPYHVRTFNLLQHFYDRVERDFAWIDGQGFRIRADRREADLIANEIPPLIEEALSFFSNKYGEAPSRVPQIEIFADPSVFSIRSVGLPRVAAHGICFGHVVTARSPSAGDFNWAEVLWHELAHVFHLQLSHHRVPRWFTEGLALLESAEGRPAFVRELDDELLVARDAGRLRGLADFNLSFTRARSAQEIVIAYHHAYHVVRHIRDTFGSASISRMLRAWGERRDTPAVLLSVLGLDVETFDQRFAAWLDAELAGRAPGAPFDLARYRNDAATLIAAGRAPDATTAARIGAAAAALTQGDLDTALALSEPPSEADPPAAALRHWVRAEALLARKDAAAALPHLAALEAAGHRAAPLSLALARALEATGAPPAEVAAHLGDAVALRPDDAALRRRHIAALARLDDADALIRARLALVSLDQTDAATASALLEAPLEPADVARVAEHLRFIRPFDPNAQRRILAAAERVGLADIAARARASLAALGAAKDATSPAR